MNNAYFKSLKFKLLSLVLMGIVPIALSIFIYVFPVFKAHLIEQRQAEVRTGVDLAFGMLEKLQADVEAGRLDKSLMPAEVQKLFLKLRYNKTDYFFAYDSKGYGVAHGIKPEFVGADKIESKDPEGVFYVKEFLKYVNKEEGGFVSYKFEKVIGEEAIDKISYVKYYAPMGWIVGSGVYLDDIQNQINSIRNKILFGLIIIGGGVFGVSWYLSGQLCMRINKISDDLFFEADKVAEVANNVSRASEGLSASTTEQASALQETSASIEETSAMISKNAENAKTSMAISKKSQDSVGHGKQIVTEMILSIQEIAANNREMVRQIDESNDEIAQIVKVINEIGDKTKVINDIVFQTKLLSFNASVEAARAGDQGKGFAVVAQEVGNLAQMSGASAKEISDMLGTSIQKVQSTIDQSKSKIARIVSSGEEKVNHGAEVAKRCSDIFDEIVINADQINEIIGEIASASHEQSCGVKEINIAVTELDSTGQQNTVLAQNTSDYAEQLLIQVEMLKKNTAILNVIVVGEGEMEHTMAKTALEPIKKAPKKILRQAA